MKKILASAVLVLMPTAAMADEGNAADGFISLAAGYNTVDQGDWSYNNTYGSGSGTSTSKVSGLDLEARATGTFPITGVFAAQIDGVFSRTYQKVNFCGGCSTGHSDDSTLAVHVFARNPDKGLLGAFVQRSTQNRVGAAGETTFYAGGEAKLNMGRVSFGGQMGYSSLDSYYNAKVTGPLAAIKFRYFPTDDLMFEIRGEHAQTRLKPGANSGYDCPDYCSTTKNTMWDLGGKAEYRLHNSRFSLFTEIDYRKQDMRSDYIQYTSYFSTNDQRSTNLRAMAGVKVNFGSKSLFERDRSGAALDPVRPFSQNSFGFEL